MSQMCCFGYSMRSNRTGSKMTRINEDSVFQTIISDIRPDQFPFSLVSGVVQKGFVVRVIVPYSQFQKDKITFCGNLFQKWNLMIAFTLTKRNWSSTKSCLKYKADNCLSSPVFRENLYQGSTLKLAWSIIMNLRYDPCEERNNKEGTKIKRRR